MVLIRIKEIHKDPTINWHNFLGYFSRKGRIRPGETLNIQMVKKAKFMDLTVGQEDDDDETDEDEEEKRERLKKALKWKLVKKQNLVPKTGKGSYNLTVPVPFEFLNKEKGFSIRQKKVEKMIQDKEKEEEKELAFKYRAREIPMHVKTEKFKKICENQEKKRYDAKRLAMAKIKAT